MKIFRTVFLLMLAFRVMGTPTPAPKFSVQLAWDKSPDPRVTEIRIYYGTASGNYEGFYRLAPDTTQTRLEGFDSGVEWFFSATAVAGELESGFSNEVEYKSPVLPPRLNVPKPIENFRKIEL